MKFNLKSLFAGVVIGAVVAGSATAFAYNGTRTIQAAFKNISIYIDGAQLTPRDSAGNVLEPFIYNGSTYLPIRAVGEAVGKEVSYDANTNSVYLSSNGSTAMNSQTGAVVQGTKLEPYKSESASIKEISMGGVKYHDALWLDSGSGNAVAYYNLGGSYTSLSGMYGFDDGAYEGNTATLYFFGDGILLKEISVDSVDLPKNFSINLSGVSQLVIQGVHDNDTLNNWIALGYMTFK